jgi:hypothetical protein
MGEKRCRLLQEHVQGPLLVFTAVVNTRIMAVVRCTYYCARHTWAYSVLIVLLEDDGGKAEGSLCAETTDSSRHSTSGQTPICRLFNLFSMSDTGTFLTFELLRIRHVI